MATKKPQVKAYVEPELKEKLAEICKQENRTESNLIELLIKRYIQEHETKQKK
jgi:predicted DNA-binding protein